MKICYFGTYRAGYSRNMIMIKGLRANECQVQECHVPLWRGIEDRVQAASGNWWKPSFMFRVIRCYIALLKKYQTIHDYDVLITGYPGFIDVFLARMLTRLRKKPLAWDVLMSGHLLSVERGLNKKGPLTAWTLKLIEQLALKLPESLIIDTRQHMEWFISTYGIDKQKFQVIPLGADDEMFKPLQPKQDRTEFKVIYYGTYIPNHGLEYMIEAARLLKENSNVWFEFIGHGPDRNRAIELAGKYNLKNITFTGWLDQGALMNRISRADILLGAFGQTRMSLMTVQNKIYEGLALAKPVVTGDSPAIRNYFRHGHNIYLCDRSNPEDLTGAIMILKNDPQILHNLARNEHDLFLKSFSINKAGATLKNHLRKLVDS
jgi:glycosyltransferase involved in cell wall biosynthesis